MVAGHRLRWRVVTPSPPNPGGWLAQLTVFSTAGGTSRLLAGTARDHPFAPHRESRFQPRWVEAIIRRALSLGWSPEARAPDYRLEPDYGDIIATLEWGKPMWPSA